jgi:hypothetical protein
MHQFHVSTLLIRQRYLTSTLRKCLFLRFPKKYRIISRILTLKTLTLYFSHYIIEQILESTCLIFPLLLSVSDAFLLKETLLHYMVIGRLID